MASDKALEPSPFWGYSGRDGSRDEPHNWGSTMIGDGRQPEAFSFGEVHSPNLVLTPLESGPGPSSPTCLASSPG